MRTAYLMFFLSSLALGQANPRIQVIPDPKGPEDFDHQFKGCPENSECDQVMGHRLEEWKKLISKLREEEHPSSKKMEFIEAFRSKYGIPMDFYTTLKSQQGFRPLYFHSPCSKHNPKPPGEKILRGTAFVKNMAKDKAVVLRDHAQIEVPLDGQIFMPQTVQVYFEEGPKSYHLSLGDQPLYIQGKSVFVLKEDDNFFYGLLIGADGTWKVSDFDPSKLGEWEEKRSTVACPEDKSKLPTQVFEMEFCKTVWDVDAKKTMIVKMTQGCSI